MAEIKVDISQARQSVLRTEEVLRNPQPFLELIAEELFLVTRNAFQKETSPDGRKWLPLSLRYAKRKLKLGKGSQGILRFRGQLFRSIRRGVEGNRAFISTGDLAHATIHQHGFSGSESVGAYTRKVKSADIRKGRKKIASGIGQVKPHSRRMKMPARPYIGFPPASQARVVKDIEEELVKRFKGK